MTQPKDIVDMLVTNTQKGKLAWSVRSPDNPSWHCYHGECYFEVFAQLSWVAITTNLQGQSQASRIEDKIIAEPLIKLLAEKYPAQPATTDEILQAAYKCLSD